MTMTDEPAKALFYEPRKGKHFDDPQTGLVPKGVRLLVMGESVYGDDKWIHQPDFARNMVQWRIFEQDWKQDRFFSGITRCFAPLDWDDPAFKDVWDDFAFWEYIQEPLSEHSRAPSAQQFERGHRAFEEVLADLKPTHVWAVSRRLWDRMSEENAEYLADAALVKGKSSFGCYRYKRPFGDVPAWGTYHPARPQYFNAESVRPCLKAFLEWRL